MPTNPHYEAVERGDTPCTDCGTQDNPVWFTDNTFWNAVMGKDRWKILCINCFTLRAEKEYQVKWRLLPDWMWEKRERETLDKMLSV